MVSRGFPIKMAVSVFLGNFEERTKHVCNPNNLVGRHLVKMDDKEANDRLMAAEAMSALSSLVLANHKIEHGPASTQTRSRTASNTHSTRKKSQRKASSGAVGKPKQTKHAKTQPKSKNKLAAYNDLVSRHSTSASVTHNDNNVIPKVMNEAVSRKVVNDSIVNTNNYKNNNNSNVDSANVQIINSGISNVISAGGGLPLVIETTKTTDAFATSNIPAALPNYTSLTATKTKAVPEPNVTASTERKTVSQSTQCTQTMLSEDMLGVGNLGSLSNLISANILSQNFNITSLPSIPSIDALKLTAGIDLASFPRLSTNTVNDVLQNLKSGVAVPPESVSSKESNKEEDRSLPFKKRRYATNQGSESKEEGAVPGTSIDPTTVSVSSSTQSDTKPLRIAPVQTEPVTLKFDPTIQAKIMSEIAIALQPDEDGDLPLHIAVVHENNRMIKKFIQLMKLARKSVDKFNKQKLTPLHLAIKLNLVEAIKLLLDANADVNYVDHTGCTSLHLTVKHQLPHLTQILFKHSKLPIDVNSRNFSGVTPLHTAVELNNEKIINILLDKGVDIDAVDGKSGRTALYHAVECKKKDIVSLLLHRGANAEIQNYAGNTAIMASQARNYDDISRILTNGNAIEVDTSSTSADNVVQTNTPEVKVDPTPATSQVNQDQVVPRPTIPVIPLVKTGTEMPHGLIKLIEEGIEGVDSGSQIRVRVIPATEHMMHADTNNHIPSPPNQAADNLLKKNINGKSKTTDRKTNKKTSKLVERQMAATTSMPPVQNSLDSNVLVSTVTETNDSKPVKDGVKNLQGSVRPREKLPATISNARTPVLVPTGIQSYINPDLRAKIQQNLKNKRLKAQLSEEKQD